MTTEAEISAFCRESNWIAGLLRSGKPIPHRREGVVKPQKPRLRAHATGIPGKGGYLRAKKEAQLEKTLEYCREFFARNDQLPPQACVAAHFGVVEQVGQKYMRELAEAGHLERNEVGKWRFKREES